MKEIPVYIEDEMKASYLDYAMSVIISRALPDVCDGLKPVHRRILYAMKNLGLYHTRPYKKTATVVGDVLGKYHPHGDSAVYDTLVRMVQDFSLRYPLIDGQGNFGSIDGDAPAAYRYTEARLREIAEEILADLDKDTIDFMPNFDGKLKEPKLLPSKFPNLLVNGSSGIAVGMATNIPPHNLNEVVDGLCAFIDNPEISCDKLMHYIKGPDFPTGGIIVGEQGIKDAYSKGRGRLILRGKVHFESKRGGKDVIVVTEIPYQVNKSTLIEKTAELVRTKKIEGISEIRDESDREGMRICIELKRDAQKEIVLNQLYKHTQLRTTFGVINLALVDAQPKLLSLKQLLQHFLIHRLNVVKRRTKFELKEAEDRAHIVEGLKIAVKNIDRVIAIIKSSKDPDRAKVALQKKFKLTEIQAKAILEMRLQKLTGLERKKLEDEYYELIRTIEKLKGILKSKRVLMRTIKDELQQIKEKFADRRRTEIFKEEETEFKVEDLIAEEDVVVTVTHQGYIKRTSLTSYRRVGEMGVGVQTKEADFATDIIITKTLYRMLFFTDRGKCYSLMVHDIPEATRLSSGRALVNLISLTKDERIKGIVTIKDFNSKNCIILATKNGMVKEIALHTLFSTRKTGIIATTLPKKDAIIDVRLIEGGEDVVLFTKKGMGIRFNENDLREMGRAAYGVKGAKLDSDDEVVGMVLIKGEGKLFTLTEKGYGKKVDAKDIRLIKRGGKGVKIVNITDRIGVMVCAKEITDRDEIIMMSSLGKIMRINSDSIQTMGRQAGGLKLVSLEEEDRIVDITTTPRS